jgi:hypothetical protein
VGLLTGAAAQNSQCRLNPNPASTNAQFSGNTVTLNFDLEFMRPRFGGNRMVYAAVRDLAGNNSGWQIMGTIGTP